MKRIVLFLITNVAVMLVLTIVVRLLGLDQALAANGLNAGGLLAFSAVFGFGGAFISLLLSKTMAKWSTGAQVIGEPRNENETWLLATVKKLADKAGIAMPEVAMYEGEPNAFATGAFRNSALVAVSTGLLNAMSRDEIAFSNPVDTATSADRVAERDVARRDRGGAGARGRARVQRRHGDSHPDPGRGQYLRRVPVARRRVLRRQDRVSYRARYGPRLLHHGDRVADCLWRAGLDHRRLVLAPTRVPRRCGQRDLSRHAAADDARAR